MPVLLAIFSLFVPRLVLLVVWFFTTWFRGMFDTLLWPILGFVFLPTTLLWYSVVQHWFGGQWTLWPIVGLVIALLIDVAPRHRGERGPAPPARERRSRRPAHA
ncbi:hypothetical protein [Vitiosangium sp. GDMCC 1.1324]|uniref:hypothetical protein n=1 Tax=Vitiosangium sp. (strain GDMCC 1.1324) TaxID=2138576 RepID=UPI000D356C9D|nr:hypothetical protein [Vitiosangium sp. GDMCC 1.1324]PTL81678.1 hypothetical protein DAT35_22305 [Vitiosangium sp. GDMCC 1.1324]